MSRYHGNNERCENCGIIYKDFRCSITSFQEAKDAMYSFSDDSSAWVYRRRKGVLRYWCGVKKKEWELHKEMCNFNKRKSDCCFHCIHMDMTDDPYHDMGFCKKLNSKTYIMDVCDKFDNTIQESEIDGY